MIINEDLVEAQIVRISLDKANACAEIELLSPDKQKNWRIVADGVDEFLMEDLGLYNIVDDILIYGADDAEDNDFVSKLYWLLTRKELSVDDTSLSFLKERIELVRNDRLKFWVINPVYGGLIFILARRILIREMDTC